MTTHPVTRVALRYLCAFLATLALSVLGLAYGLTLLARRGLRDTLIWEGNRLLRAAQRLNDAGEKLEDAIRILVKEGGYL